MPSDAEQIAVPPGKIAVNVEWRDWRPFDPSRDKAAPNGMALAELEELERLLDEDCHP